MLNYKNEVNIFLDSMTNRYIEGMRNVNFKDGDVLWGGEIEINALANLFDCTIEIYNEEINEKTREEVVGKQLAEYNNKGQNSVIRLVYCDGNHYKFIKPGTENEIVDVERDGNCLFYSYLGATGQEQSLEEVKEIRGAIADYISEEEVLRANIRMMFEVVVNCDNKDSFFDAIKAIPPGSLREQVIDFVRTRSILKEMKSTKDQVNQIYVDDVEIENTKTDLKLFEEVAGDAEVRAHETQFHNPDDLLTNNAETFTDESVSNNRNIDSFNNMRKK